MEKQTFLKQAMIKATFVALILLVASCGPSQPKDSKEVAEDLNKERFDKDRKEKDAQFLVDIAEINMKQIRLGQLAQQKGTTPQVKELGKMVEDAHTKSQRELTALARSMSITIPTTPTDDVQDAFKDLNERTGVDFDKAYADKMVSKHNDAISAFEKATTGNYDTEIKNWAIASLPALRTNLNHSNEYKRFVMR